MPSVCHTDEKQETIMKVFVTGATGFVGSAVVEELLKENHKVVGLARSSAAKAALEKRGVEVVEGRLEDSACLSQAAAHADAVIHTAFNHDFSKFKENCEMDEQAIHVIGSALRGSQRPFIVTSGLAAIEHNGVVTENLQAASGAQYPRRSEHAALALAEDGVKASVVRLAPSVHGVGDHGFIPHLIHLAKQKGFSAYVATGDNQWCAVHRLDAASLYRLVLENGESGRRYHAVQDEAVTFRKIALAIGNYLKLPVRSLTLDEAKAHFTWFAGFAQLNCPASAAVTREALGWEPQQKSLLFDLANPAYYDNAGQLSG
ncbi:GDP-L-fucose synthase [Thalassocella blandensis]|nr:GDP-L-fucose synthase [Thalassocella blandensis]